MSARGEGVILVNDREVRILFTNRALLNVEKQLNKGILGVLEGFVSGSSGVTDLMALMRCGMEAARLDERAGGKPVSNDNALQVIDEVGFTAAIAPVMEAVAEVISYDGELEDSSADNGSDPN